MKRVLTMNLQRFAEGSDNTEVMPDFDSLFGVSGTSDMNEYGEAGDSAPASPAPVQEPAAPAQEPKPEVQQQDTPSAQEPQDGLQVEKPLETVQDQQPPAEPEKPQQSAEDNAKFAAERREREYQQRLQTELEQRLEQARQQAPEYQLAQFLSNQSGLPVDQVLTQLKEQAIQQEAQKRGVPVEVLKEIQAQKDNTTRLEQELNQMRFQAWQSRTDMEQANLKQKYDFLSDEDFVAAKRHMLNDLRNPNLPLEQAVLSLHGGTLLEKQKEALRQELLAEMGGRKQSPLAPQGARQESNPVTLTADEKEIARQFNMTEDEYAKWK